MRKVSQAIAAAILAQRPAQVGNTAFDGSTVTLHGNPILHVSPAGAVEVDLAVCRRWPTATTCARVSEVLGARGDERDRRLPGYSVIQFGPSDVIFVVPDNVLIEMEDRMELELMNIAPGAETYARHTLFGRR